MIYIINISDTYLGEEQIEKKEKEKKTIIINNIKIIIAIAIYILPLITLYYI